MHIVLVHPDIPPNTGNIIRLAANTGSDLHLIEPLGFTMDSKLLRRAGLDYHEFTTVKTHASWEAFLEAEKPQQDRMFAITSKGSSPFADKKWQYDDWAVFGSETQGLPEPIRDFFPNEQRVRLPMAEGQRCINLSNAAAVVVYEAWRQNGYVGGK